MKKSTLSFLFIAISAAYVAYLNFTSPSEISVQALPTTQQNNVVTVSPLPAVAESSSSPAASSPPPPIPASQASPAPIQKSKPSGMYADGTYTGSQADAYYGTVQVQATIQNGVLADVSFLQYPSDRRTSQSINGRAMPILKSEAIQAQNANVNIVSGATDTSMAFQQSLADALTQAKS